MAELSIRYYTIDQCLTPATHVEPDYWTLIVFSWQFFVQFSKQSQPYKAVGWCKVA